MQTLRTFIVLLLFINSYTLVFGDDIQISSPVVDLKDIQEGVPPSWNFLITNISKQAIAGITITPGCTCTNVTFSKNVLKPGESTQIEGTLNPLKLNKGVFRTSVTVGWPGSDGQAHSFIVQIQGNLKVLANIYPKMLDFGPIDHQSTQQSVIDITRGDAATNWVNISARADYLNTKVEKIDPDHFRVIVSYDYSRLPLGALRDQVQITLLDQTNKPLLKYGLAALGEINGDIIASPKSIFASVIDSNKVATFPFSIKSLSGKKIKFISIQAPNEFTNGTLLTSTDALLKLLCTLNPQGKSGNISGVIKIHVKTDVDSEIDVPCIAYANISK